MVKRRRRIGCLRGGSARSDEHPSEKFHSGCRRLAQRPALRTSLGAGAEVVSTVLTGARPVRHPPNVPPQPPVRGGEEQHQQPMWHGKNVISAFTAPQKAESPTHVVRRPGRPDSAVWRTPFLDP